MRFGQYLFKHAGDFGEEIDHDAIGFAYFDTECMNGEHRPLTEPVPLSGSVGSLGVSTTNLSLVGSPIEWCIVPNNCSGLVHYLPMATSIIR